ncbi:spore germination protein KC [Desulfitispora alkaliphila]|uniref:Ger(x)C family spore germination protein n=1 Tax=Desulfitispora alkaliphila TaxID=622674 RepID=UPI003D2408BD
MNPRLTLVRKIIIITIFFQLCTFPMGCWDNRNIEDLAIVVGMGLDRGEESDYRVTFQVARPDLMGEQEEGNGGLQDVWVTTQEADSIFDAVRKVRAYAPWELFFGHTQIIVIGEDLAEEGVGPAMDFVQRETDLRRTVLLAVARGEAKTILGHTEAEPDAIDLMKLINIAEFHSVNYTEILGNFIADIDALDRAAVAPGFSRARETPDDEEFAMRKLEDTAVFKGDKLVGWLDEMETRGLIWIRGRIINGVIVFRDPVEDRYLVNVEVTRARTDIDLEIIEGTPVYTIKVTGEGRLASHTSPHRLQEPKNFAALEKRAAGTVEDKMRRAVERAQEFEADYLHFGTILHRNYPEHWKQVKDDWSGVFRDVEVNYEVKFKIRRAGLITRSINFSE